MVDLPMDRNIHDQQFHDDLTELQDVMPFFAAGMLRDTQEFLPFATAINSEGELEAIYLDSEELLSPFEMLLKLEEIIQCELATGRFRACGICTNVITHPENGTARIHAICLSLMSSKDFSVRYYIPYEMVMDAPILKHGFFRNSDLKSAS